MGKSSPGAAEWAKEFSKSWGRRDGHGGWAPENPGLQINTMNWDPPLHQQSCYGLDFEALTWLYWDTRSFKVFMKVITVKWGHKGGALISGRCPYKKKRQQRALSLSAHAKSMWRHSGERWPSASQEERSQQKPTPPTPWSGLLVSGTVIK